MNLYLFKNYYIKTYSIVFTFLFVSSPAFSQIKFSTPIYKVNFSNTFHEPRYVSYRLYKGGGTCDRRQFRFKNDKPNLQCATDADYSSNGIYEKGHLVNAEDFAFDCIKDEMTFRYYNCLPQTTNLNKGKWKTSETIIRNWSKTQKLYIICGGFFSGQKMRNVDVPSHCWKVVQSVATKKVLFCGWYSNTAHATLDTLSVPQLEAKLGSRIILLR